jgi:hypothetical protein
LGYLDVDEEPQLSISAPDEDLDWSSLAEFLKGRGKDLRRLRSAPNSTPAAPMKPRPLRRSVPPGARPAIWSIRIPRWRCAVADRDTADSTIPNIVLSTAHAAKFPDAVEAACWVRPELPAWLDGLMTRPEHIKVMKNDQVEVEQFVRSVSRAAKQGVAG